MDDLVKRLRGATDGLCTENPYSYMARGISAGDCIEAADALTAAQAREAADKARIAELEAELAEARRRRDEWLKKAEGFDTIRHALREKVGSPWPPNLSRALWAALAVDEKKRADDAEAELARRDANENRNCINWGPCSRHDGSMSEGDCDPDAETGCADDRSPLAATIRNLKGTAHD